MSCGIYKITNIINNKCYIGQSVNIERRWHEEKTRCMNPDAIEYNTVKSKAFRKYRLENFIFEIIEECDRDLLNQREYYWANYYNAYVPYGYNVHFCGEQGFHFNKLTWEQFLSLVDDLINTNISEQELAIKYDISLDNVSKINMGKRCHFDDYNYPLRTNKHKKYCCPLCGQTIDRKSQYCITCANKLRQTVERPSRDLLLQMIATSSFEEVGRKYGVSGKAVTKWCKAYDLPSHKKELVELYKKEQL